MAKAESMLCAHGRILGWRCGACQPRCAGCGALTMREILDERGRYWLDDHGRCWLCRMIDHNFSPSDALRLKFKAMFARDDWETKTTTFAGAGALISAAAGGCVNRGGSLLINAARSAASPGSQRKSITSGRMAGTNVRRSSRSMTQQSYATMSPSAHEVTAARAVACSRATLSGGMLGRSGEGDAPKPQSVSGMRQAGG